MTTVFQSRKLVRDEIVSLFVATGAFQDVFSYWPSSDDILAKNPLLLVRSGGTSQSFEGQDNNPTEYAFELTVFVNASESAQSSSSAEDQLDALDLVIRQVIRDNAGGSTNADMYKFDVGTSTVGDFILNGSISYIREVRTMIARLNRGAI
jgi:hypothetical protein